MKQPLDSAVTLTQLVEHPLVKEMSKTIDYFNQGFQLPYVENDKVLMSPGVWNNYLYSKEEILKAYKNTDWSDRYTVGLYYDHEDNKSSEWIGEVKNIRLDNKSGFLYGDLYYYDPNTAMKLAFGKPKSGISPKVKGSAVGKEMVDFVFLNFSHVINPAVKTAYINNSEGSEPKYIEVDQMGEEKPEEMKKKEEPVEPSMKKISGEEILARIKAVLTEAGMFSSEEKKPEEEKKEPPKKEEKPLPPAEAPAAMNEPAIKKPEMMDVEKTMSEMKTKFEKQENEIAELKAKLNEPEQKVVVSNSSEMDTDMAMLEFMKKRVNAV